MLIERDKKFVINWEQNRLMGKWKYSFRKGVVQFAWPVFVLSEIFKYVIFEQVNTFSVGKFFFGFILWTIMGFLFLGLLGWRTGEKAFDKIKNENPEL